MTQTITPKMSGGTYDEEAGAEHHSFHLHVQVQRELDPEVVGISEGLAHEAHPLLGDLANHVFFIERLNLN